MRRKSLLAAVGLSLMLALAGCAGTLGSTNALGTTQADDAGGPSTIDVTASGEVEAEPDQAIVRIAVEATADDASTARERLAANVSEMRSALADLGIADDAVATVQYDIREEYRDQREKEARDPTYRAVHAFEVTLNDLDRTGTVIDTAVENGATRVDGVRFTLADDTRRELHDEALRAAMSNARSQADTLAESGDLAVTGVHAIRSGETNYRPYYTETASMADSGGSTSIDTGSVSVTAQVQVTYNATAN